MLKHLPQLIAGAVLALVATPALGEAALEFGDRNSVARAELPPYLQCVPYAREVSGIQIYGDAHSWWGQAEGRYERGNRPRVGAVMAFIPHGNMRLGHVAAVSEIVDSRTVLLRHANWSPIDGRRGQIEDDVRAVDVSEANDWSEVRVWYDPIQALGGTAWPVHGFIYNERADAIDRDSGRKWASAAYPAREAAPAPARPRRDIIGEIIAASGR